MNFLDYLNVILKHWKFVVLVTVASIVLGVLACFIVPKIYEAKGKLLITQDNMSLLGNGNPLEDIMLSSLGKSDPLTTQMEILKTRPILTRVIDSLKLVDSKNKKIESDDFVRNFSFSLIRNTNLVEIRCRQKNPDTAALMINLLVNFYTIENQNLNQEIIRVAKEFIEKQLVIQKEKLEEAEQILAQFKSNYTTVALDKETDVNIDAYASLNAGLIQLNSELSATKIQGKFFKDKIKEDNAVQNPSFNNWLYLSEQADDALSGLEAKKDAIKKQIAEQEKRLKGLPTTEIKFAKLLREQQIAIKIYTELLSKYEEYKVQEVAKTSSAKLIEPAIPPKDPIIPKKKILVVVSFLFGLSLSVGILYLIDYIKGLPHSVEEIQKTLGYSVLGSIPYMKKNGRELFYKTEPGTIQSESIRIIQAALSFKIGEDNKKIILVTSAHPKEGKSVVAANLAYSYAKSGKKALLLGMDFRKPTFNEIFGIKKIFGIVEALNSKIEPQDIDGLKVFGPGDVLPTNPMDLVQSKKFGEFLTEMKKQYDVIIIDTAPIKVVAETQLLLKWADVPIVVIDMSSVSMRQIQTIKHTFEQSGVVPSVVINKCMASKKTGYYYY